MLSIQGNECQTYASTSSQDSPIEGERRLLSKESMKKLN